MGECGPKHNTSRGADKFDAHLPRQLPHTHTTASWSDLISAPRNATFARSTTAPPRKAELVARARGAWPATNPATVEAWTARTRTLTLTRSVHERARAAS